MTFVPGQQIGRGATDTKTYAYRQVRENAGMRIDVAIAGRAAPHLSRISLRLAAPHVGQLREVLQQPR